MFHYLFTDYDSGENFIVGADSVSEAYGIAKEYFADPHFICEFTDDEAEMSGLDEY